jgi:hypothetical protein
VHPVQCFFSLAASAQDHEIVGIGHDPTAKALPQSELFPSQHKQTGACRDSPAVVRVVIPAGSLRGDSGCSRPAPATRGIH